MTKTFEVRNAAGANLRDLPSTKEGAVVAFLPKDALVNVSADWTAENTVGCTTKYAAVYYNKRWLWCVASLLAEHVSYLDNAAKAADKVFGMIVKNDVRHAGGANSYETILEKKVTTCGVSASAVLQEAGCLPVGKTISHTAAVGTDILKKKDTLEKAVKGTENLIEGTCTVVRVGKKFADLPDSYKKAGMVYIQDSNACVSAGNDAIYSCNNASGEMENGVYRHVRRTSGYPFNSPIIYVIAPNK